MNKNQEHRVICIASFDRCYGDNFEEGLDLEVVPVGSEGWAGLLEAAKLQEADDETCDGYFVTAMVIDSITNATTGERCWDDLCQDQMDRIYSYLSGCETRERI